MKTGKLRPYGDINFPGFQSICEFVASGAETSKTVSVDGDTDKEYIIYVRNLSTANDILVRLNADSGANYGYQYFRNLDGTITAARSTTATTLFAVDVKDSIFVHLLTPVGFNKTGFFMRNRLDTGNDVDMELVVGCVYNNTANITSINFSMSSGYFSAGSSIFVFAGRTI